MTRYRKICPREGAGCDTRSRMLSRANFPEIGRFGILCVKKISVSLTGRSGPRRLSFVKKIAVSENGPIPAGIPARREFEIGTALHEGRARRRAQDDMVRTAQMERQPGWMWSYPTPRMGIRTGRMVVGLNTRTGPDRGRNDSRSFFSSTLCVKSFTDRWVPQSRPLRGGKEGSACRAM